MLKRFLHLCALVLGLAVVACQPVASNANAAALADVPSAYNQRPTTARAEATQKKGIPDKAYKVWAYVKKNGQPMPNYVGGRTFQNREGLLPKKMPNGRPIVYQEWDVNPKVPGVNRGAERLCTGSDGRAYYTDDHYRSFKEL